jgi:uncharacterized membrane protein
LIGITIGSVVVLLLMVGILAAGFILRPSKPAPAKLLPAPANTLSPLQKAQQRPPMQKRR